MLEELEASYIPLLLSTILYKFEGVDQKNLITTLIISSQESIESRSLPKYLLYKVG